jgi:hypothetical protein
VVDSTAGELAARRRRARRRIDGLVMLGVICAVQVGWLAVLGYVAYRVWP